MLAALNRNAVGPHFIWAHGLVGTFVTEDPKFDRGCQTGEQIRVEN